MLGVPDSVYGCISMVTFRRALEVKMSCTVFQVLNEYFHNVCELDLVFNFYKVGTEASLSLPGGKQPSI